MPPKTRQPGKVRKAKRVTAVRRQTTAITTKRRRGRPPGRTTPAKQRMNKEDGLPTGRPGTWQRTNALLLAALRVWELKHGFRLLALPGGYFPIPAPLPLPI